MNMTAKGKTISLRRYFVTQNSSFTVEADSGSCYNEIEEEKGMFIPSNEYFGE